jgi:abortive infection bacteriophage resistance protein
MPQVSENQLSVVNKIMFIQISSLSLYLFDKQLLVLILSLSLCSYSALSVCVGAPRDIYHLGKSTLAVAHTQASLCSKKQRTGMGDLRNDFKHS